ncbi:hypothetical protein [uncultured Parabacteroides sp.]|uniref:hypothetical protein n=1 Tax=uncultured Parabacteroides sp. TaxID=512312 RepID=UPI002612902E|nr:hypothetical protein [uncultured Parabacteroides sp.]
MISLDQKKRLEALLPSFLAFQPCVTDSPVRLLALARVYASLYRLVSVYTYNVGLGERERYTRLGDRLFRVFLRKAKQTENLVEWADLISALFFLTSETTLAYDVKRENTCREAVIDMLVVHEDWLEEPYTLRCLTDFFYPTTEADNTDAWFIALNRSICHWAEALSVNGSWTDVSYDMALLRIEVMNRYSYMLLDKAFDFEIQKAYGYYKTRLFMHDLSLSTLARLYDVAMLGNAYSIDRKLACRVADFAATRANVCSGKRDENLFYLSIVVDWLCESIFHDSQRLLHY